MESPQRSEDLQRKARPAQAGHAQIIYLKAVEPKSFIAFLINTVFIPVKTVSVLYLER